MGGGQGGGCHHDRMEVKTSFLQKVVRRQAIRHWVLSMCGARNNVHVRGGPGCPLRPAAGALRASLVSAKTTETNRKSCDLTQPCKHCHGICFVYPLLPCAICMIYTLGAYKLTHTGCLMICATIFIIIMTMMSVQNPKHSRHSSCFYLFFFKGEPCGRSACVSAALPHSDSREIL